jgi:hypothetical protein
LKVVVYVEGAGDRICLETLLAPLIREKTASGVSIQFVPVMSGDRKHTLLTSYPKRAANAIINNPQIFVVILPDLYPPNKGFDHRTCEEMQTGVRHRFGEAIRRHGADDRFNERFQVFCLIHDLEALLLAAEEQFLPACGLTTISWTTPVEEQNHDNPPKRIVEKLIRGYQPTVDGPRILANADYRVISARCSRGFGQFVAFLESVNG